MKSILVVIFVVIAGTSYGQSFQDALNKGQASQLRDTLTTSLQQNPSNDAIRMERDMAAVLAGIEHITQQALRHGLHNPTVFSQPAANPGMEVSYAQIRGWLGDFRDTLEQTASSLEQIPDSASFHFPVDLTTIKFRINDGTNGLVQISDIPFSTLARLSPYSMPTPQNQTSKDVKVQVGVTDARWLEGYCKLVAGSINCILAYNEEACFNHVAHMFFERPATPYSVLLAGTNQTGTFSYNSIIDIAAFIHTINFPLQDPVMLQCALRDYQDTVAQSRRMVKLLTSQDPSTQHWLAGPGQRSITGQSVSSEMLMQWMKILDHSQAMLAGKELAPFWRNAPGKGINLNKLFTEPRDFDLVLWLQGTGAVPFLEAGEPISATEWGQSTGAFNGQFLFYAFWFN